ncbi:MAG: hypothetical protein LBU17_09640 [Treponema sp.]|jgi:hypothetical protein|nr:hypothetical protein [Treponema sp.]
MKKFLSHALYFLIVLLLINGILFFVSQKLYSDKYTQFSLAYPSYLLADSHGEPLSNGTEKYGIYNFSYSSDSYIDMYRKITFLLNKTKIDTLYIVADEHALSPYREKTNNLDRSLFYCTQYEFDNYYEYVKERYIKQYLVIFQPKVRDLVRSYLYAKVINIILPKQHQPKDWAEMAFEDRIKNTEERVLGQFPSQENSATLEATLLKIIHTCEEHDIKLIGIKFPLSSEYLTVLADKTYNVAHILKSNGIAILDYNSVFRYNNEYFQDTDHLNKQGGLELVKLLGADINQ